jgi:hypothetical protein
MNLIELKKAVDDAVERAKEHDTEPLEEIIVSLQIDLLDENGDCPYSVYTNYNIELHYDNNGCASGCVLVGCDKPKNMKPSKNKEW